MGGPSAREADAGGLIAFNKLQDIWCILANFRRGGAPRRPRYLFEVSHDRQPGQHDRTRGL